MLTVGSAILRRRALKGGYARVLGVGAAGLGDC